jgi:FkbM family methyltransferase
MLKNLPINKLHTITLFNKKVSFCSRDEFIHSLNEIFLEEIYKQQLHKDPFIIDCGANIGLSVIYMKRQFPNAKIIAFEPDNVNFELLQRNIAAFEYIDIELRKEAIWFESTTLKFSNTGSLMSRIEEKPTDHTIEVKAFRLKDLMDQQIDFLKIDIEGAEYSVLIDIENNLHWVQNMFIEYHGTFQQNEELNHILSIVSKAGFTYYIKEAIDKHPTPFDRTESMDYDVQLNIFCFRK